MLAKGWFELQVFAVVVVQELAEARPGIEKARRDRMKGTIMMRLD